MPDREKTALAIDSHMDAILRNGTLVYRKGPDRNPGFVLRFRDARPATGGIKQRALHLGQDPVLLARIREIVSRRNAMRTELRAAKAHKAECRMRYLVLLAEIRNKIQGSRRYIQSLKKALWSYCSTEPDPSADGFLAGLDALGLRRRRRGRPYARRLW